MVSHEPPWGTRPAREVDRSFLLELNRAAFRPYVEPIWGWDEAEQVAYFNERFDPLRREIVEVDGAAVGELWVEERAEEIFIARIALMPEWQGRGIGSSLVRDVLERGIATGKAVALEVLRTNPRARRLYESLGFNVVAEDDTRLFLRAEPT